MNVLGTLERWSGRATQSVGWVRNVPNRLTVALSRWKTETEHVSAPSLKDLARVRQEELASFYARYEDLVELLCDAAQYGPESRLNQRYDELRGWMMRHYPGVQPYVVAFLELSVDDMAIKRGASAISTDAFEALWASPTLLEQLRTDDGLMIERIMRTREALNRYAEQLRRLCA